MNQKEKELEELKKEVNPFTENPDPEYAKLWSVVHKNSILVATNAVNIEWLKKRFNIQLSLGAIEVLITLVSLLSILVGLGVIKL